MLPVRTCGPKATPGTAGTERVSRERPGGCPLRPSP